MSDIDAAIERASGGPRITSDPYWQEVDADDRLLADEVKRLRDLQRAAIAYQGPLADEVERLRAENARLRDRATEKHYAIAALAHQFQCVPAQSLLDTLGGVDV